MKKISLLLAIAAMAVTASAQTRARKDTVQKAHFEKFIKISPADYKQLFGLALDRLADIKWHQLMSPDEKIKREQQIDYYLKQLPNRVKVDSTVVKK